MTLWAGRLDVTLDGDVDAFTESRSVDVALWRVDVAGSLAHVEGLAAAGLVSEGEAASLRAGLAQVAAELDAGTFTFAVTDEDVHTAVERRVTELCGPTGAKLHTGRSRNDQVALDVRLFAREAIVEVTDALLGLVGTLAARADAAGDAYLPGYTHLQRAQPVTLAHHLRAHAWALLRDADRLADAATRVDVSPLGAGALAGSSLPLDPAVPAAVLGFAATFANSLDAVSDRDFVAELCFCLALLGVHLSRMGEELVLWTTAEFGFAELDDRYATGSSMLPQKKNPDVAELARGKAGRLLGNLTAVLATLKALPLAYDRDLQEDKAPLFDSVRQSVLALRALDGLYATLRVDTERMAGAASDEAMAAIDLVEWLVLRGVPFREAHRRIGGLVADSLRDGGGLARLVTEAPDLGPDAATLLVPGAAVARRTTPGGAGPAAQVAQRAALGEAVAGARARAASLPRLPR